MEQSIVMIPMYSPETRRHCAVARILPMGNYALVETRFSGGANENKAELYLLTDQGQRAVKNGRAPLRNETLFGIAAMDAEGKCFCCGPIRGQEASFEQALIRLRMSFPRLSGDARASKAPSHADRSSEAEAARLMLDPSALTQAQEVSAPAAPVRASKAQDKNLREPMSEIAPIAPAPVIQVAPIQAQAPQEAAMQAPQEPIMQTPPVRILQAPIQTQVPQETTMHVPQVRVSFAPTQAQAPQEPAIQAPIPAQPITQTLPPCAPQTPQARVSQTPAQAQAPQEPIAQTLPPCAPQTPQTRVSQTPAQTQASQEPIAQTPQTRVSQAPAQAQALQEPIAQTPQTRVSQTPAQTQAPQGIAENEQPIAQKRAAPPQMGSRLERTMEELACKEPAPAPPPSPDWSKLGMEGVLTPLQPLHGDTAYLKPSSYDDLPGILPNERDIRPPYTNYALISGSEPDATPVAALRRKWPKPGEDFALPVSASPVREERIAPRTRIEEAAPPALSAAQSTVPHINPNQSTRPSDAQNMTAAENDDMPSSNSPALERILQEARAIFAGEPQPAGTQPPAPSCANPPLAPAWRSEGNIHAVQRPPAVQKPRTQLDRMCDGVGARILPQRVENPFLKQFPGSSWVRVQRAQGQGHYLEGRMRRAGEFIFITAVPGEYSPVPPRHLQGFTRYIQTKDGGYWIRIQVGN